MAENAAGQNWWERAGQNLGSFMTGGSVEKAERPEHKQESDWAEQEFGSDKPADIAKSLTLENLKKYRQAPETFGLSEAEKQASADKAAAASGAAMATGLAKGTREMMGGGTTGYASQAMREAAAPTRQAAATASQQATALSQQMIEQKGNELYAQLTGRPMPPPLGQQMLAAGGTAALTAGGKAFGEYVGGYLDPDATTDPTADPTAEPKPPFDPSQSWGKYDPMNVPGP